MIKRRGFLQAAIGLFAGGAAVPAVVAKPKVGSAEIAAQQLGELMAQNFPEEHKFFTHYRGGYPVPSDRDIDIDRATIDRNR